MFEKEEVRRSLSHFISGCIIIAILLVMVPISYRLPGSSKVIFSSQSYSMELSYLIVLVLVLAIIGMLFNIRYSVQLLLGSLISGEKAQRYSTAKLLSDNIINVVYVPIIYVVALMFVRKIVDLFPKLGWLLTILTLFLIGFILLFLIPLYRGLRTYFETSPIHSAERVRTKLEEGFIVCPNCGYKNPPGSKFCVKCGAKLPEISEKKLKEGKEETEIPATEEELGIICPNCGYKNPPGSKFCINCGTPLISAENKNSKQE